MDAAVKLFSLFKCGVPVSLLFVPEHTAKRYQSRTPERAIEELAAAYQPSSVRYRIEDSPFRTLLVDITHRCNMACKNCYIPVRHLPDMPADWLYDVLARLPRRSRIRLVGAEATVRQDLPDIITRVRQLGHIPIVLTNGLKLGNRTYVRKLKAAGLRTLYLSLNGGLRDDLYQAIDDLACADRKLQALDNILAEKIHLTVGVIAVRGVNDEHIAEFLPWLESRGVRDVHVRSVGPVGEYMRGAPFSLDELEAIVRRSFAGTAGELELVSAEGSNRDFRLGRMLIQLTHWPDLGSRERGRITPDGFVEPHFESMLANEFQY